MLAMIAPRQSASQMPSYLQEAINSATGMGESREQGITLRLIEHPALVEFCVKA